MRPIRVAFVVHQLQVAGAEMLVRQTIERLGPRLDPLVLGLDAAGAMADELRAAGVPVASLGRRPGRDWGVAVRMAAELRRHRTQVVHAHQYSPFFYAALARLRLGRAGPRIIFTEHGRHFPDVVSPKRRAVNRLLLDRLADRVNACCRFSADALVRKDGFAGRRVAVIPNGVEAEKYGPPADRAAARRSLGLDPSRRYVVCVARFHPVKDHATLIAGFDRIARRFRDVDLLLAGGGELRDAAERQAQTLGIAGRVRFLGVRRDVPALLGGADLFALTSLSEAASLTLLEAMATGLPVAVTAVGGNGEIVRHGREGLLFPRGDAAACGDALARLLGDPSEAGRLGAAGRVRVWERYRLEQTVAAYGRMYEELSEPGA